jgi:hypothetical protein
MGMIRGMAAVAIAALCAALALYLLLVLGARRGVTYYYG